MSGLEGGVSAFNVFNNSGNVTIAAGNMTGTLISHLLRCREPVH